MTTCQLTTAPLAPTRSRNGIRVGGPLRRGRVRRLRRAVVGFLAGWTHRPSDEAVADLAARDRIGERF